MRKGAGPATQARQSAGSRVDSLPVPGDAAEMAAGAVDEAALLTELRELVLAARQRIATVANAATTLLYWNIGSRLLTATLQDGRAAYGKQVVATVSRDLTAEFGQSFSVRGLYRAMQFCQRFPDQEIVSTLSTQMSWSHFMELLSVEDPLARDFYAEMCRVEPASVKVGYEISFNRHFYAPPVMRTLEEIGRDIADAEREASAQLASLLQGVTR